MPFDLSDEAFSLHIASTKLGAKSEVRLCRTKEGSVPKPCFAQVRAPPLKTKAKYALRLVRRSFLARRSLGEVGSGAGSSAQPMKEGFIWQPSSFAARISPPSAFGSERLSGKDISKAFECGNLD